MKQHLKAFAISAVLVSVLSFNGFAQALIVPKAGAVVVPPKPAITASSTVSITALTTMYIEIDSTSLKTCYVLITKNSTSSESSAISCAQGTGGNLN